ncbi:MAG: 4-hydroxyphenylpyruvate dioxygenase [Bdellovibrionales bacterium]|nr:4-hydroxyphenylpyruvate dioxygenase [Bdellovibrionales bacterium]
MSSADANWENTAGLDGIEFIEYSAPDPSQLISLFDQFGFKKVGVHKSKKVTLFRQGDVNFIINEEPDTFAAEFAKKHGPSICAVGLRVKSTDHAMKHTLSKGARDLGIEKDQKSHSFPGIYGIGDSAVYFIDRYQDMANYKEDFDFTDDTDQAGLKVQTVDHLTNNVPQGEMQKWCDFYTDLFNFREAKFFDIKGEKTGLVSKVMKSPCGKIIIPINEPTDQKSQIQEYLDEYDGSGIQHLALLTSDIEFSVSQFRERGVKFLEVPDTYYEMVPDRLPGVEEDVSNLQKLKILVDGDEEGYLLQIFSQNIIGPIFFEVIQRKGHDGFGEGNFQALFDAIERDQKRRGYL